MIRPLKWDSDFFHVKIVRIFPEVKDNIPSLEKDFEVFYQSDAQCAYFEIDEKQLELVSYCQKKKLKPLCTKVELVKVLTPLAPPNSQFLTLVSTSPQEPDLVKLSRQIAVSSRFFFDPYFKPFIYKLYKKWITQSLEVEQNKKAFFIEMEKHVVGVITVTGSVSNARIELFGIEKEFRLRGFGSILLQAAQSWAFGKKYHTISVETKLENKEAMGVYKKNGFRVKRTSNQYHLWK